MELQDAIKDFKLDDLLEYNLTELASKIGINEDKLYKFYLYIGFVDQKGINKKLDLELKDVSNYGTGLDRVTLNELKHELTLVDHQKQHLFNPCFMMEGSYIDTLPYATFKDLKDKLEYGYNLLI
ncbi:hypothetical protein DY052_06160 [Apilactobacillus timberlakei]|uniref:hypothetical protein n=1 Tax=Apilactobacillus timberlakei TaxID=2008380 RepID=UPI00112E9883|nr:hypothetical protein [Apilactobacillus timberlakei]TPR15008.1 hypothetical protein DY052_06160 [Apilactobacillus timberlakei]